MSDPWRNPHNWPYDLPGGYIFAGRAIELVGRALFGDDWGGDEFRASVRWKGPVTDPVGDLSAHDAWRIYECLRANAPSLCPQQAIPRPHSRAEALRGDFGLTAEQVAAANAILTEGSATAAALWKRGFDACATLGEACLAGKVQAFYRDRGGQPQPVRIEVWATTPMVVYSRLSQLRISPNATLDDPWIKLDGHNASPWLFFGERGLCDLVSSLAGEPVPAHADESSGAVVMLSQPIPEGKRPSFFAFARDPARRAAAQAFAEERAVQGNKITTKSADQCEWLAGEWRRLYGGKPVPPSAFLDAYKPSKVARRKGEQRKNIGAPKVPPSPGHERR